MSWSSALRGTAIAFAKLREESAGAQQASGLGVPYERGGGWHRSCSGKRALAWSASESGPGVIQVVFSLHSVVLSSHCSRSEAHLGSDAALAELGLVGVTAPGRRAFVLESGARRAVAKRLDDRCPARCAALGAVAAAGRKPIHQVARLALVATGPTSAGHPSLLRHVLGRARRERAWVFGVGRAAEGAGVAPSRTGRRCGRGCKGQRRRVRGAALRAGDICFLPAAVGVGCDGALGVCRVRLRSGKLAGSALLGRVFGALRGQALVVARAWLGSLLFGRAGACRSSPALVCVEHSGHSGHSGSRSARRGRSGARSRRRSARHRGSQLVGAGAHPPGTGFALDGFGAAAGGSLCEAHNRRGP